MRIIAGTKRGMKLFSPKVQSSRPIIDRVKESLFSVLQKYGPMEGAHVADLFCGVGSIGLEALSRGAERVIFVEQNQEIIVTLKRNIEKAQFSDKSKVIRTNAFKTGAAISFNQPGSDFVFVDPPYAQTRDTGRGSQLDGLLRLLAEQIASTGVVVVRTRRGVSLLDEYGSLKVSDRREWGTMAVTILGLKNDE